MLKHLLSFWVLIFLSSGSLAMAEVRFEGLTVLAAMHEKFPCGRLVNTLKHLPHPAIQVLWGTFGTDTRCLRRVMSKFRDRQHLIEIHLSNHTCRPSRGRRCFSGEVHGPTAFDERLKEVIQFFSTYGNSNTVTVLTAALEDEFTDRQFRFYQKMILARWSGLTARNSLLGGNYRPANFSESHSPDATRAELVSLDGNLHMTETQVRRFVLKQRARRKVRALYLWRCEWQGGCGKFIPPRKREFEFGLRDEAEVLRELK